MVKEQIVHDLSVALVSAKAQEHTAQEYVSLYYSLSEEVKKAYEDYQNSKPMPKAEVFDRRKFGI